MFRKIRSKNSIIQLMGILYIATIGLNMLSRTDNFNVGPLLNIRYIYLLMLLLYFFSSFGGVVPGRAFIMMAFLMVHSVLFGFVFINSRVKALTNDHGKEMVIYTLLIFLTCYFVWSQGLFLDFMAWNYWTTAAILLRAGITHTSHFVNPVLFVHVFSSNHNLRSTFGFGHANFTGNMCVFTLAYSVFLLEEIRREGKVDYMLDDRYVRAILVADILVGEIFLSTQSRTSVLAGLLFAGVYVFYNWYDVFKLPYRARAVLTYIAILGVVLFLALGGPASIWEGAHRSENVSVNYPLFKLFSPWTGMGYVPPYGFYTKVYGLDTFALDIYYLYIFFSTGYLGTGLIVCLLLTTLIFVIGIRNQGNKILALALYATMLLTGIGQTSMVVYTLISSMINWTIICIEVCPELPENL